jgi:hypothetical protein
MQALNTLLEQAQKLNADIAKLRQQQKSPPQREESSREALKDAQQRIAKLKADADLANKGLAGLKKDLAATEKRLAQLAQQIHPLQQKIEYKNTSLAEAGKVMDTNSRLAEALHAELTAMHNDAAQQRNLISSRISNAEIKAATLNREIDSEIESAVSHQLAPFITNAMEQLQSFFGLPMDAFGKSASDKSRKLKLAFVSSFSFIDQKTQGANKFVLNAFAASLIGSAITAAVAILANHMSESEQRQYSPQKIGAWCAAMAVLAFIADCAWQLSATLPQERKLLASVEALDQHAATPGNSRNRRAEARLPTKQAMEKAAQYSVTRFPLAVIFADHASHGIVKELFAGMQKAIDGVVRDVLKAKDSGVDNGAEDDLSHFNQTAIIQMAEVDSLIDSMRERLSGLAQQPGGKNKEYTQEVLQFVVNNKHYLAPALGKTIIQFARQAYLEIADHGVFGKLSELDDQKQQTAMLKQTASELPSSSYNSSNTLPDIVNFRIASAGARHAHLRQILKENKKTLTGLMETYTIENTSYAQLQEQIKSKEFELSELQSQQNAETSIAKKTRESGKQSAHAGKQRELKSIEKQLEKLQSEERQLLDAPGLKIFIDDKALQIASNRHLDRSDEALKKKVREQGYGYESTFYSPAMLVESVARVQKYIGEHRDLMQSGAARIYFDMGKPIGYGYNILNADGDKKPYIAHGIEFEIDHQTGKICHIYPYIPHVRRESGAAASV